MRVHLSSDLKRGKKVQIFVDGETVEAFAGETIAAALLASGIKRFRYTRKKGDPRGIFCGMGVCFECLVTVNGESNVRACLTPVVDGMKIDTKSGWLAHES
ncbi:MAG: (2Fe-2S)-binding protein [Anaerolineae bacterium]|nr:(2Fe-2S)-binding protein [Anaerolineae bacterium]